MNDQAPDKHDQVLLGLTLNLQSMAMQQMGKLQHPETGEAKCDLAAAAATIDILEMLKVKCRDSTHEEIVKLLDGLVMDLQLNYMDEVKKNPEATEDPAAEKDADDPSDNDGKSDCDD